MDGARVLIRPKKGVLIKGVYGYQRLSFQKGQLVYSEGIVRGIDAEIHFNETFKKLENFPLDMVL